MTQPVSDRGYARPELLAETDWLESHLDDSDLRIIDARSPENYGAGHIPGAVNLFAMRLYGSGGSVELPDAEEFSQIMGGLGVGDDTSVVVYDGSGPTAGRVVWALWHYGHMNTRFLDGNVTKWMRESRSLSTEAASSAAATFTSRPTEGLYCGLDHAKDSVGKPGTIIWDVRSPGEYDGSEARTNPPDRAGHLPGAVHLEWTELLDPESKTLKSATDLQTLLGSRGITPESEVISY
jgi:thiosulfate/3-mercaptopyruvate sulfurtransferase